MDHNCWTGWLMYWLTIATNFHDCDTDADCIFRLMQTVWLWLCVQLNHFFLLCINYWLFLTHFFLVVLWTALTPPVSYGGYATRTRPRAWGVRGGGMAPAQSKCSHHGGSDPGGCVKVTERHSVCGGRSPRSRLRGCHGPVWWSNVSGTAPIIFRWGL